MLPPRKILVACDFSPVSEGALDRACQLADSCQAELTLLHILPNAPGGRRVAEIIIDRRRHAEERLMRLLDASRTLKIKTSFVVREGTPAREIVKVAADTETDLIVMGTHGRSGLAHVALGSVAEKVLRTTACPVLVIREDKSPIAALDDDAPPLEQQLQETPPAELGPALDLLARAVSVRATDVHIDPWSEGEYLVRFRIDGKLSRYCTLGNDIAEHLVQRFKLLASLDVADPFRPREGRLKLPPAMSDLEVRITTSPVAGGEAVALRLFSRGNLFRELTRLGLTTAALTKVDAMLRQGQGLVLVTGPTGSGKTTTVYSMLAELASGTRNIVSIEDPVEYHVPFVRQMAVDERHGVTMTSGLKTLLRMDPDIIFVGEIRDVEAADIAMRAASSGRYVFSTLHTRDVASTITACRDLHIDNRSLAGNVTGIINQRLVRRLCPDCREPYPPDNGEQDVFAAHGLAAPKELFRSRGCDSCQGRGYLGRIGVFEVALVSDEVRDAIARGVPESELRGLLRSQGTISLPVDALAKVTEGITRISEALEMTAV